MEYTCGNVVCYFLKRLTSRLNIDFIHCESNGISSTMAILPLLYLISPSGLYIITRSVYKKAFAMMIYKTASWWYAIPAELMIYKASPWFFTFFGKQIAIFYVFHKKSLHPLYFFVSFVYNVTIKMRKGWLVLWSLRKTIRQINIQTEITLPISVRLIFGN